MARKPRTAPRKSPQQRRAIETVDAILEATARVLVSEGYDRASTNRVALAAGVSVGSLYQYFPSKEALVAALIDRHSSAMMAVFEAKMAGASGAPLPEVVREVVSAMVAAHAVEPQLHEVLAQQVPRVGRLRRIGEIQARAEATVRAFLESRRGELRVRDVGLAAFMVVQIVEGITHATARGRSPFPVDDALADEIADVVLRYLLEAPR